MTYTEGGGAGRRRRPFVAQKPDPLAVSSAPEIERLIERQAPA